MPTCGSRPICSRSRCVAIRFTEAAGSPSARMLAIAGLAFFLVRTGGDDNQHVALRPGYDRELAALDSCPARRADGELRRPALRRALGDVAAAPSPRHGDRPQPRFLERPVDDGGRAIAPASATGPAGRSSATPPRSSPSGAARTKYWRSLDLALAILPREAFDYVWLIDPPPYDAKLTEGLRPVWRSGTSVLYRVESNAKSETPAGNGTRPIR